MPHAPVPVLYVWLQAQAMAKVASALPPDVVDKLRATAAAGGPGAADKDAMAETAKAMAENPGG